jgi:hypothetical protein
MTSVPTTDPVQPSSTAGQRVGSIVADEGH